MVPARRGDHHARLFAVVALVKVYAGIAAGAVRPSIDWLNPFADRLDERAHVGVLVAIFIYWGWDSPSP